MLDLCRKPFALPFSQTVHLVVLRPSSCKLQHQTNTSRKCMIYLLFCLSSCLYIRYSCLQRQGKALEASKALTPDSIESRLLKQRFSNRHAPRFAWGINKDSVGHYSAATYFITRKISHKKEKCVRQLKISHSHIFKNLEVDNCDLQIWAPQAAEKTSHVITVWYPSV